MTIQTGPRYLTKSRFKLALECPTKLFYTGKADLYPDCKQQDEFLQALADGGFQVGELAKLMFPGGIEIASETHDEQVEVTARLLERDQVTLFEAAIRHGDLFARVDVLRKTGLQVELIEVKAKSFDSSTHSGFRGLRGGMDGGMKTYLQDVAFQRHVLGLAYPGVRVKSFLMLVDKAKTCSVDGLNQRFRIRRVNSRPVVTVVPGTDEQAIGSPVLGCVNVDDLIDEILRDPIEAPGATGTLAEQATIWAKYYREDVRIQPTIGAHCGKCEFRVESPVMGVRSGLHDCWRDAAGVSEADFAQGTVLDLSNFRGKGALIKQGVLRLSDVPIDSLGAQDGTDGISRGKRQAMQVTGQWPGRSDFFLDLPLMRREMGNWEYPLHFIDFETARVAVPFFVGQRPYANIAFQFSHHVVNADEVVEHRSQFLSTTPGNRPNYHFVRALKAAIGATGTVFMWSPHENTTLIAILEELEQDPDPPSDIEVLSEFIRSLTTRNVGKRIAEVGSRAMVDLCRLAERAFFHPATKGSNSIKKVLPAVIKSSEYLKQRYSQPIYGAQDGVRSLNFENKVWWQERGGNVMDPYRLLCPVFKDIPREAIDSLEAEEDLDIAHGGAATMAYARLQFEDIAPINRSAIEAALLRYCELDTLAMVMVVEAWREWLK